MADRRPLIAGNWKMHKTIAEAEAFVGALLPRVGAIADVDVAVCPPFTALQAVVESARGSGVAVYAQTVHQAPSGAYTGEVSAPMLTELDVGGVLLGHSERRELFGETDRALSEKVPAAMAAGLQVVLCVGETEAERERGDTERKLRHQVQEGLERLDDAALGDVVIAYEPIWAIGTGLVATPGAGAGGDRLRPRARRRSRSGPGRAHARALRRVGQARQRRRAARAARRRRGARGRRSRSTSTASRRSWRRRAGERRPHVPGRRARRPRRLGARAARPRERHRPGPRRRCSTISGPGVRARS